MLRARARNAGLLNLETVVQKNNPYTMHETFTISLQNDSAQVNNFHRYFQVDRSKLKTLKCCVWYSVAFIYLLLFLFILFIFQFYTSIYHCSCFVYFEYTSKTMASCLTQRGLNTHGRCFAKEDKFCYFLFVFLHTKLF